MLYREIIAVCSQIHTKRINTLCGQNIEFFLLLNLLVRIITTGLPHSIRIVLIYGLKFCWMSVACDERADKHTELYVAVKFPW
jgi:hypothetical protein